MVGVDPGLSGVQQCRWDPFAAAVLVDAGGPFAGANQALMGPAAQGEFVDVGLAALRVVALSVVGLAAVPAGGAARAGAATIAREQHEPLPDRGNPLTTPEIQRHVR